MLVKKTIVTLCFLFLILPLSYAVVPSTLVEDIDQIVINSKDYKDVYAGLVFAKLTGKPVDYLLTPDIASAFVDSLPRAYRRVLLIEPSRNKQYSALDSMLTADGFMVTKLDRSTPIHLQLADSLSVKHIILTDERYPYNAISIVPYALQQEAFVVFAQSDYTDEILTIIEEKQARVTTYGIIDTQIAQAIEPFNPTIIDQGGKFDNNLHIVKLYLEENPIKQIIITNGEFVEIGLVDDFNPILFVGRSNVPTQVEDFLATSDITHAVVVGNHLTDTVSSLKSRLALVHNKEIAFVVRFAKSPRVQEETFSLPTSLDYFALPIILPELTITNAAYNRLTKQLEVTYHNPSEINVFFVGSHELTAQGEVETLVDEQAQALAAGQQKTILYDVTMAPNDFSMSSTVLYGDYPNSLEYSFEKNWEKLPIIELQDTSSLVIDSILYDKLDNAFYITLTNDGAVPVHTNVELIDVIIDGIPQTIGTTKIFTIDPGESKQVYIRATLSDLDLRENEEVEVVATYGQRKTVLFKQAQKTLTLHIRFIKPVYVVVGVVLIVILLLLFFILRSKPKVYECDRCGHKHNGRNPPTRHSCGGRYKKV